MAVYYNSQGQKIDYNPESNRLNIFEISRYEDSVKKIMRDVYENGDEAVKIYTERFDGVRLENFFIDVGEDIGVDDELKESLKKMYDGIHEYHEKQRLSSYRYEKDGSIFGLKVEPLDSVLVYVPGGKYPYPSTLLMGVIPAKIAGVKNIYVTTPPKKEGIHPAILYAAYICGLDRVYTVGGVQGVSAFAFGTESIPKVDKIVGPGNIYVSVAKRLLYGVVDIDTFAGPSEVCIIADSKANKRALVDEMLAQLEHDELAKAWFISNSRELIDFVIDEIKAEMNTHPAKDILLTSFSKNAVFVFVDDIEEAFDVSNSIAPEHLYVDVDWEIDDILERVKYAGGVFIGKYSTVPAGDYGVGPNHVLPTMGMARFSSPLGVYDFYHRFSFIKLSKETIKEFSNSVIRVVREEGFYSHGKSLEIRGRF